MIYNLAKKTLEKFVEEPLHLQFIDRADLEERAVRGGDRFSKRLEQKCVNYLRHSASDYDRLARRLNRPDELDLTDIERHVLHVEKRCLLARLKQRILDEIGEKYPWLRGECVRQKRRDGIEENPGEFILPFGPFKGWKLRDIDADYLIRLLGYGSVQRSYRTRIERHVAERLAACTCP